MTDEVANEPTTEEANEPTVFHPSAFVCLIVAAGEEDTKAYQSVIGLEDLYQKFRARLLRELTDSDTLSH